MSDTLTKFSKQTVILHWLVALGVIGLGALGFYMEMFEVFPLYHIHKSIGVLLFIVIIARVIWRLKNGFPTPIGKSSETQLILAKIVHWILLIATLLMPIAGMIGSGFGGHGFGIFGLDIIPQTPDPTNPYGVIPPNKSLAELGSIIHLYIGWVIIVALVLHLLGAIKHHLIDKDGTLLRMLGKNIEK